jgi:hypothetical protein
MYRCFCISLLTLVVSVCFEKASTDGICGRYRSVSGNTHTCHRGHSWPLRGEENRCAKP